MTNCSERTGVKNLQRILQDCLKLVHVLLRRVWNSFFCPCLRMHGSQKIEAVIGFDQPDVLEVATDLPSPASWMTLFQVI